MTREDVLRYVLERYGTEPDYPWMRDPESAVLRRFLQGTHSRLFFFWRAVRDGRVDMAKAGAHARPGPAPDRPRNRRTSLDA